MTPSRIRDLLIVVFLSALISAGWAWGRSRARYIELAEYHRTRARYHQGSAQVAFGKDHPAYASWMQSREAWLAHWKAYEAYQAAARYPWMSPRDDIEPRFSYSGVVFEKGTILPCPDDDTIVP
jgi:hypothetical protein